MNHCKVTYSLFITSGCYLSYLKKHKDPLSCSNYCPISLLCADVKLLAKMLDRRLECILPTVIATNQTVFVKNRHTFHICYVTIWYSVFTHNLWHPWAGHFNGCRKGIWPCGLTCFTYWNVLALAIHLYHGFSFYIHPLLLTNNDYSDYLSLERGTRQCCPLSPLLFAIAIDPLAVAVRSSQMQGISRAGKEHYPYMRMTSSYFFPTQTNLST